MAPAQVYEWSDLDNVVETLDPAAGKQPSPLEKMYFTGSMLDKYEPCVDVLQKVLDADGEDEEAWNDFEVHFDRFMDFSWCSRWDGKKYDIVLYGVSGYTGYLTMEYLKRVALRRNPEPFTFAFAGRTVSKVQEMRDREFAGTEWEDTPILQASFDDVVSVIDLAKSAHVIINVAGPYSSAQGEVLVDACCHLGTHYCDVSGELPWTLRALELNEHAKQGGALISPSAAVAGGVVDVLVYMCAKKAREDYGEELRRAINYSTGGGSSAGASGGTLATRGVMAQAPDDVKKKMADPFTLGGFIPEFDRNGMKEVTIEHGTGRCVTKIRKEENDALLNKVGQCPYTGIWRAPNMYAFFNTRIVRRSNQMMADLENQPYGRNFNFQEFTALPAEAVQAMQAAKAGGSSGSKPGGGGASVEKEKEMLEAQGKYYKQGEGPPLEDAQDSWIANMIYAQTTSGKEIKCAYLGNDGYFETARCAVEWAMTARFDYDKLRHKGGVLNAAVSGGESYARRLINSGVKYKMGGWFEPAEFGPVGYAPEKK